MVVLEQINKSYIAYKPDYSIHVREYYMYCVQLLKKIISNIDLPLNIQFDIERYNFRNQYKTIKIGLQYEHTLLKENGRGLNSVSMAGNVVYKIGNEQKKYIIRIDRYENLISNDLIIEYSIPNILNIKTNTYFSEYLSKVIHIYPIIYNPNFGNVYNKTKIITTFSNIHEPRRFAFLEKCQSKFNIENHTNIYETRLVELYNKTRILINIRQTDFHDTLEELRVLPALLNGVIVVNEIAPLQTEILYNKFLLSTKIENFEHEINKTIINYNDIYNQIFSYDFYDCINDMTKYNEENLKTKIISLL